MTLLNLPVPGTITGPITHTGSAVGFYSHTPVERTAAYTLTYASVARTLPSTTAAAIATTAPLNVGALFAYASEAQAASIPTAINALLADLEATKKLLGQLVKDLQGYGLLQ